MRLRDFLFLALGCVIAIAVQGLASPWRVEAGAGVSKFSLAGENVWWQSYYPHQEDLNGTVLQLGISKVFWRGLGIRAAYVDLGEASNSAIWNSDNNFYAGVKTCSPWCAQSVSKWKVYGVSLGPIFELHAGPVTLGVEAGLYRYMSGGRVNFSAIQKGTGGMDEGICEVGFSYHNTLYKGLNVAWKNFWIAWRRYDDIVTKTGDKLGLLGGKADSIVVGISVPLQ